MTEPTDTSFSAKLNGPPLWRIAIVVGASLVILMSAALTMGASRAPSAATSALPAAGAGSVLDPGPGNLGGPWHEPENGDMHGFGGPGFGIGRHGFGQITITAISGSNLSLKTVDGWTRTIAVSGSTTITKGGQEAGIGDLKVGDQIHFRQTRNADGTFTISAIDVVLPRVGGTVAEVTGSGFTLADPDGATWTIATTGSTAYTLGNGAGTAADVKTGVIVVVEGTLGQGNALTATAVHVQPARIAGQVTATSADTITVTRPDGTSATIHVGSGTTYQVPGVATASLSDIAVGMFVAAEGTLRSDGSLSATVVLAHPAGRPGPGPGRMHGGDPWGFPVNPAPSASPSASSSGA
jgi:hypothetical protein